MRHYARSRGDFFAFTVKLLPSHLVTAAVMGSASAGRGRWPGTNPLMKAALRRGDVTIKSDWDDVVSAEGRQALLEVHNESIAVAATEFLPLVALIGTTAKWWRVVAPAMLDIAVVIAPAVGMQVSSAPLEREMAGETSVDSPLRHGLLSPDSIEAAVMPHRDTGFLEPLADPYSRASRSGGAPYSEVAR